MITRTMVSLSLACALTVSATAALAQEGGRRLTTTLTGAAEAPNPGDPDGSGTAEIRINPGQRQLCFKLTVTGIDPATAAHVHEAPPGVAGPIVAGLSPPTNGSSQGCVGISRELAMEIIRRPGDYYVNVHNAAFRGGALRGQLDK